MKTALDHITWGDYLTAVTLLITLYYAYIGIRYYRREITGLYRKVSHQLSLRAQRPHIFQYSKEGEALPRQQSNTQDKSADLAAHGIPLALLISLSL